MLGLLILLIIGSIIALRTLPEYKTIEERALEQDFIEKIGHIRAAIDIDRSLGDKSPCKPEYDDLMADPGNPVKIEAYLKALSRENFLNLSRFKDPAIPDYRWGTGPNQLFWQVQLNLVSSDTAYGLGSFEAGAENNEGFNSPTGWVNSLAYNDNATFSPDTPSFESDSFDDYPGQNRLGRLLSLKGYSLRLATYTP